MKRQTVAVGTRKSSTVKRTVAKSVPVDTDKLRQQLQRVNALAANWKTRLRPHKKPNSKSSVTTGSDCSGYGSDVIAYTLIGLTHRVRPVQWSENDPVKVALHHRVSEVCGLTKVSPPCGGDITERQPVACDVYVSGYPCPSFSNLGKKKGVHDKRGMVTLQGLEYIALTRPKVLTLEQVAAILQKKHEKVWNFILKTLTALEYNFVFGTLNTKDFGIPQSRSRVYVLAVAQEICQGTLTLPQKRTIPVDLHHFLKKDVLGDEVLSLPKYENILGKKMWQKGYVLDVGSSEAFQSVITNAAPCLTKSRLSQEGYYIPKLRRRLLPSEAAALQGVPAQVFAAMAAAVTDQELTMKDLLGSLGDAMSINVLASVLRKGLHHAGFAKFATEAPWLSVDNSAAASTVSDRLFEEQLQAMTAQPLNVATAKRRPR